MCIHINQTQTHLRWSKNIPPIQTISSGETVTFDAIDSSNGQITATSDNTALERFDLSLANPVLGPVYIHDAQPGDVLKVEILGLEPASWGWSAVIPNFGLLADEFPQPALRIWGLNPRTQSAVFRGTNPNPARDADADTDTGQNRFRIPLRPFLGCMGVAPPDDRDLSTIPPTHAGGNLDCRDLTVGSIVYFPVMTEGALFSCGDGHAAQGDGEVCGTAIETPLKATLRFHVCKSQPWVVTPQYESPSVTGLHVLDGSRRYATTGVASSLEVASKQAVRNLIQWLVDTKGMTRVDAYILASVAGDLKITEAVNMPNYVVSMSIPLGIFD
ncbi:hypothetical protein EYZ11_001627 [Aspergillus tanneri]|uniref:Formamidase n=1 Tax=Aspergillus tanneri TaxID=1220188 RepID=A0A4V3UQF9_9EURO|nr:uncharacterized protein ATNIH1004_006073 [Aspergillus tanneri]KAA8647380.1 hypothetical protein ATNIH1004_006073 [Aspergillus tanneri]THC98914.1 hypothetical protein EYZ11_001627 [Aspergillus tanneri]